jgi:hypothetical protein
VLLWPTTPKITAGDDVVIMPEFGLGLLPLAVCVANVVPDVDKRGNRVNRRYADAAEPWVCRSDGVAVGQTRRKSRGADEDSAVASVEVGCDRVGVTSGVGAANGAGEGPGADGDRQEFTRGRSTMDDGGGD